MSISEIGGRVGIVLYRIWQAVWKNASQKLVGEVEKSIAEIGGEIRLVGFLGFNCL